MRARLLHERPWLRAAGRQPDTRRTAVPDRRRQGSGLPAGSLARDPRAGPAGTGPDPGDVHHRDGGLPEGVRGAAVARREVRDGGARVPLGLYRGVPGSWRQPAAATRRPL